MLGVIYSAAVFNRERISALPRLLGKAFSKGKIAYRSTRSSATSQQVPNVGVTTSAKIYVWDMP